MSLELWGAIGLLALVMDVVTMSGLFLCVTLAAISGAVSTLLGADSVVSIGIALASFVLARWIGNKLGADDALLRYEETGHNIVSDDGARVHIAHWNHYDETLVEYQNRMWPVKLLAGHQHRVGDYRVVEVKEHHLLIEPLGRRYWPKRRPHHT